MYSYSYSRQKAYTSFDLISSFGFLEKQTVLCCFIAIIKYIMPNNINQI